MICKLKRVVIELVRRKWSKFIGVLRALKFKFTTNPKILFSRLITANTYEREMFDKASLKLGLDKAVLQSMTPKDNQQALTRKEVEDLLKKGAYGAVMDEDNEGGKFSEEDIDTILQRRTQTIRLEPGVKGSTFAKASFGSTSNREVSGEAMRVFCHIQVSA